LSDIIEEIIEGYRLSPQQRRLWQWMCLVGPKAFRGLLAVKLRGRIESERLRQAWQRTVRRHEVMRTSFRVVAGMDLPVQVIDEEGDGTWVQAEYVEVECGQAGCSDERCAEAEREWKRLQVERLEAGSRWQARAVRCGTEHVELVVSASSLCADGRTLRNVAEDMARYFAADVLDEGTSDAAAEPADNVVQYADFSEWQNDVLETEEAKRARAEWPTANRAAAAQLPHEHAMQVMGEYVPAQVNVAVTAELVGRLRAMSSEWGAELKDLLEAGWRVLLWRLCGNAETTLARRFDGRRIKHLESACGLFVKYLPVHCYLAPGYQFSEIVKQVRDAAAVAAALQDYLTSEAALGADSVDGNHYGSWYGFDYESLPGRAQADGVSFTISRLYTCTERFKLRLSALETDGALYCELHYDPAIYAVETVERWAMSFVGLLESAAREPHALVGDLDVIGERERGRLLAGWNNTEAGYERDRCLHELFEEQATRTPDLPAVVFGENCLSYRDLNRRANQVARYLVRLAVGPEVLVAISMERSVEAIVALLGVLKAGGAYVPLDYEQPSSRLSHMISDSGASVLLTEQGLLARFAGAAPPKIVCMDADAEAIARESCDSLENKTLADNLAYVIYTSGSTGLQKGVMVQHRSVVNLFNALHLAIYARIPAHSRVSVNAPLSFDASVKQLVQLLAGHALHIVPNEIRTDGEQLLNWLRRQRMTVFDSTPGQMRLLLDAGLEAAPSEDALRAVLIGGEAIGETLWAQLRTGATKQYYNVYGPTECTVDAAFCEVNGAETPETSNIGRPLTNVRLYVLDSAARLLPTGVAGELYIGGEPVARGYLNRPELTAEKFVPDPFSAKRGARLYRTGDVVRYLAGGEVEYLERADHQVKVRGFRIELGEIESALHGHRAVRDCVVVTRDDGSGGKRLIAYVVTRPWPNGSEEFHANRREVERTPNGAGFLKRSEQETDYLDDDIFQATGQQPNGHGSNGGTQVPEQAVVPPPLSADSPSTAPLAVNDQTAKSLLDHLRQHLREQLPEYMLPSSIVLLVELPLTRHGKVDRSALPAPESQSSEQSVEDLPRTPHEELVAGIWEEVLRIGAIGRDDNFFELGGHSLLATQVVSRIRDAFQINIPLRTLFEHPTVATFAAGVEQAAKEHSQIAPPPLRPVPRDGALPLSFAQQRLWFVDQLEPGRPFYNVRIALRVDGHLNVQVLRRTLDEVVRRHEVLRTTFVSRNGYAIQSIASRLSVEVPTVDLSALDATLRERAARLLAHQEARRPFDLSTGPLLRVTLLRFSEAERVALFTTHHIISDGWSLGVLVRELVALYEAFSQGQPSPLAELPIQYADYAVWQRDYLQGEVLERQLDYWRNQLAGAPAVLELPMARPRSLVQTYRGATSKFHLDAELAAGLRALSRREGVTLFMTLLAGWQTLLARYSGQEEVVVGTAIANRVWRETEDMIGFFINTLVLRTDVGGEPRFTELLKRVREVCLGAYAHQDVPFERLVEELRPERTLSHSPLFQVAFGLNNAPRVELELPGVQLRSVAIEDEEVRFDLTLWIAEGAEGLHGRWTYRTELFDAETINLMTQQWETLLRSIVASPDAPLGSLEIHTEAERMQRVIEGKARTESNYKKFLSVKPEAVKIPTGSSGAV